MGKEAKGFSRRQFLLGAGVAGVGTVLAGRSSAHPQSTPDETPRMLSEKVPVRTFGRSGRQVSILSLGGMFDIAANQLLLRQAVQ